MELRDNKIYQLETDARREALRRSMEETGGDRSARRRVGGALVAVGLRIGGERPRALPSSHYA